MTITLTTRADITLDTVLSVAWNRQGVRSATRHCSASQSAVRRSCSSSTAIPIPSSTA